MKVKEESEKVGLKLNIQKTKIMASSPICSWQIYREKVETRAYFIFLGFKITVDSNYSHEIKRHSLFGRKGMTILSESENEVAQLCLTLCDPMDCSLPGSSIHGIFQARILEWTDISFSRGSSQPKDWTWVSCIAGRRFTVWVTREALMTILNTVLKSRDITLPTKVYIVKDMVFFSSHV